MTPSGRPRVPQAIKPKFGLPGDEVPCKVFRAIRGVLPTEDKGCPALATIRKLRPGEEK
jgi:hypothetical protein